MGPKNVFAAVLCTTLMGWSGMTIADEYRSGEFFTLDLSKAVLSPKPLGPPTQFAPVPIEARADRVEPRASAGRARRVTPAKTHVAKTPATRQRADKSRAAARTKPARPRLARPRGNPLDAQARDTRIQVWPCRSGGICNWK
jgi:hypothetical protein